MTQLRVLISGGGIAGPAAAFWLSRLGHSCTVLERFPSLRTGGQQIDIRGQGIEAAKRMGILDQIRKHAVDEGGLQYVDMHGNQKALLERNDSGKGRQSFTSEYEIMRGDLCKIIYDAAEGRPQYRFGTSVESFENVGDKVNVKLTGGNHRDLRLAHCSRRPRIKITMENVPRRARVNIYTLSRFEWVLLRSPTETRRSEFGNGLQRTRPKSHVDTLA
ncbi:hypothetical protein NW754_003784 [Fusarium falciforme]|nr:hypothetical protein NW754_003784 [Fusarium falciforme]